MHNPKNHPAISYMEETGLILTTKDQPFPRQLFVPSREVLEWDGADVDTTTHAIYSDQHDVFSPVEIKVTGRKLRLFNGAWGIKCRVRLTIGESYDRGWFDAVMMQPGGKWTNEKFWL